MRRHSSLNERQQALLGWIANGCPDGTYDGHAHKVTARALADRHLVKISKRGGTWQATLTEGGNHYLTHGTLPGDPSVPRTTPLIDDTDGQAPLPKGRPVERPTIGVDALLEHLRDGDGALTVADPAPATRAAWRRTIDAAKRSGGVPDGKYLWHRGRDRGDLVIELRAGVHPVRDRAAGRTPLDVPDVVDDLHPLVGALVDPAAALGVSPAVAGRAVRVLHVLLTGAEQQGCGVGWATEPRRGLVFCADGHSVGLVMREEWERRDVVASASELEGRKTYAWQRVPAQTREVRTGRLLIELDDDWTFRGRRRRWADRQRWRLEDKLGDVLAEILQRLRQLRERQLTTEREAVQRDLDWRAAMTAAGEAFQQARRVAALDGQVTDWEKAGRIRAFCDAVEHEDVSAGTEGRGWIFWARQYADDLDPCGRPNLMPPMVKPTLEDLRPYLNGWSP